MGYGVVMDKRKVAVVTTARSDYGLLYPILIRIKETLELELQLLVSGMHLSPEFGYTVEVIEEDGFEICDRVEMLLSSDSPTGLAKSMGLGTIGFAQVYERIQPDILLVLGDRFETHCAVVASLPFKIPVAHIHGGESTEGLIDEPIRHSITKMSHIHFPATQFYAERIERMGEEKWRIFVSGAPGLDNVKRMQLLTIQEFKEKFGVDLSVPTLLVTYHPVTLEYENTQWHLENLFSALEEINLPVVFTYPNADTKGRLIITLINEFLKKYPKGVAKANLGQQGYLSMMKYAAAMVGNSSSGIIEAPSFELPTVNIGNRQRGRVRATSTIDVGYSKEEILAGIKKAISSEFKNSLNGLKNPYGEGNASEIIVNVLKSIEINDKLILKRFNDVGMRK